MIEAHSALQPLALVGTRGLCVCATPGGERHRQPRAVQKYWAQVTFLRQCTTSSSSLRRAVDGASLQFIESGGSCRYATETGTHSAELCTLDWFIDVPVVVHVEVVDNTVVAQRPFPLVQPRRPLRFPSCSPLIWCSTSRCAGPASSRVQSVRKQSSSHSCSSLQLDTVVHMPIVVQRQTPMVQTSENCESPAVAVHLNRWSMSLLAQFIDRSSPYGGCGGGDGFFGGFSAFFALFRIVLELSASFLSPRW